MALTLIALRMRPESERSECELETDTRNNTAYIHIYYKVISILDR